MKTPEFLKNPVTVFNRLLLASGMILVSSSLHAQTLLLEYDFNTGGTSTTTAYDSSGNGLNGTFLNSSGVASALQTVAGVSGNTGDYAFDNSASTGMGSGFTGGKVSTSIASGFDILSSFTISLWLNPSSTFTNTATVFSLRIGTNTVISLAARSTGTGQVNLTIEGLSGLSGSNTVTLTLNAWNYLAVTYDGSSSTNNVTFYQGSTTSSVTASTTASADAGTVDASGALTLSVGNIDVNYSRPFDGYIDNLAFYSGILDTAALESLRLEALAVPEPTTNAALLIGVSMMVWVLRRKRAARSVSA